MSVKKSLNEAEVVQLLRNVYEMQREQLHPSFRTNSNYAAMPRKGEVNTKPSKTVPNQSMTIQEVFTRYAQGRPLTQVHDPQYYGEEVMPDLKKMDLVEIQALSENLQENLERNKDELAQVGRRQRNMQEVQKRVTEKLLEMEKNGALDVGKLGLPSDKDQAAGRQSH